MKKVLLILMLVMFVPAYVTAAEVSFDVEGQTYEQIWKAAITVMSEKFVIKDFDKQKGEIYGKTQVRMASWGEKIRLYIIPIELDQHYIITVKSKKKWGVTGTNWSNTVMLALQAELGEPIAQAGGP